METKQLLPDKLLSRSFLCLSIGTFGTFAPIVDHIQDPIRFFCRSSSSKSGGRLKSPLIVSQPHVPKISFYEG